MEINEYQPNENEDCWFRVACRVTHSDRNSRAGRGVGKLRSRAPGCSLRVWRSWRLTRWGVLCDCSGGHVRLPWFALRVGNRNKNEKLSVINQVSAIWSLVLWSYCLAS